MKKRILFLLTVLVLFLFFGCDGNFGVQEIFGTYLIIKNPNNSKIMVQCKSEKLKIPSLSTCSEVTDEEIFDKYSLVCVIYGGTFGDIKQSKFCVEAQGICRGAGQVC